mgnify:FL=1
MGGPWEILLFVAVCAAVLFYAAARVFGPRQGMKDIDAYVRRRVCDERERIALWLRANAADSRRRHGEATVEGALLLEEVADMLDERTKEMREAM